MRLEKLFVIQDYGVYTPDKHRVWQTLYKRRTDCFGPVEFERGWLFSDWNLR